ncbi:hypothetical protein [Microcoleus sp. N3A4]|uniref:hypothetical protein n=1 Tax=Microcoleus sp. N3A4 TaxID=3055379 RepID=UPI002FD40F1B
MKNIFFFDKYIFAETGVFTKKLRCIPESRLNNPVSEASAGNCWISRNRVVYQKTSLHLRSQVKKLGFWRQVSVIYAAFILRINTVVADRHCG